MKHSPKLLAILYGVGTYFALFLVFTLLPRLAALCFPSKEALGNLGPVLLVAFACLPVSFVLAPFLGGFVTARASKERPYVHLFYVVVISYGLVCLTGFRPHWDQKGKLRLYGFLVVLNLLSSLAGTWLGWSRSVAREDEELMETLRNIKP